MDDTDENSRFLPNYGMNQGYRSSQRPKVSARNVPYPQSQLIADKFVDEDDNDEDPEEEEEEIDDEGEAGDDEINGTIQHSKIDNDNEEDDDIDEDYEDDDGEGENHSRRGDGVNLHRHPKKRKLKSLLSSYELAPRVPVPTTMAAATSGTKPAFGGRNALNEWSEHETFVLLEAWGERFLERGRKSLRSEEWQEVAEKVSQVSKIERTDSQCRNRLDTLKKKYKKEKTKLEGARSVNTKWVYFKKMDTLMSSTPQNTGLSCGVDSGEYVFMNPSVYLNRANGLDEMRDSPGDSGSREGDGDGDSDLLPLKRSRTKGIRGKGSFRLLADSIRKFSETYEKIENSKTQQMIELEKMRMDFHRELEMQKMQILNRARDEIAKIRQGDYEENEVSAENVGG